MNKIKFILALLICSISHISQAKVFTFTAIPDQDQSQLRQRFNLVAEYLSEQLDIEVKYLPVKSYAAAITAFRNNQVQLAWFGGLSGVRARHLVPGSEAVAQGMEDQHFVSYFIAHHATQLNYSENFPQDLAGKTFTFGAKGSTSGRLMPEYYIRKNLHQVPQEIFKVVGYSGDHTLTINQVQAGAYQVGVVNFQVWETMLTSGKINTDKVKVIWKSPQYPDYQWTIRANIDHQLGEGFKHKLTQALLNMKAPELLSQFPREAFIPASNDNYLSIKKTAIELGLLEE